MHCPINRAGSANDPESFSSILLGFAPASSEALSLSMVW